MINLNHLHYFFVCAQHKSVTRAAESLRISQPSLSQILKTFESELGEKLFVRNGRQLDLSKKGKMIFERAKGLFEIAETINEWGEAEEDHKTTIFRIGVSDEIERPFVAEVLSKLFRPRYSHKNRFSVVSKSQAEIASEFSKNRLELAITNTSFPRFKPFHHFDFPVFLATSRNQNRFKHLDERNLLAIFNSLDEGLIVPSKELILRSETNRFLRKAKSAPPIVFESNFLGCMARAIREEIGCGFLPLPYIYNEYEKGTISIVGPAKGYWQHRIFFYSGPTAESALAKSLIEVVEKYLQ